MARVELYDGFDMGAFEESELNGSTVTSQTSTLSRFAWSDGRYQMTIEGQGFTYGGTFGARLTGGVVTGFSMTTGDGRVTIAGTSASGAELGRAYAQNDPEIANAALLAGDDEIRVVDTASGADHTYLALGYAGNDLMVGGGVLSTFSGGPGSDTLQAGSAAAGVLSGDDGDDVLVGGAGADSLTGGAGRDELTGGGGNDLFVLTPPASGLALGDVDTITDWQAGDRLVFGRAPGLVGNYAEATAGSASAALGLATSQMAGGAIDYVAVEVGGDVWVFADSRDDNGGADDAVRLAGASLADVSHASILAGRPAAAVAEPALPAAPAIPAAPSARVSIAGAPDLAHLGDLSDADVTLATSSTIRLVAGGVTATVAGAGFTYDVFGDLTGGTVTGFRLVQAVGGATVLDFNATFAGRSVAFLAQLETSSDPDALFQMLLGASPLINGSAGAEVIHGGTGAEMIFGAGGLDSLFGGAGSDVLFATAPWGSAGAGAPGSSYLRGEDGDDYIVGGGGFDDIHGNMGRDTESGGAGPDWVVGGKDQDLLFGDGGADIVLGNMGEDTCVGGADDDVVRGGQADDLVLGGAGDDWLAGDRGSDTVVGGEGADIFHGFDGSGLDRVLDFTALEGDRVNLLPGTQYSVAQVGADTVVTIAGAEGGQLVLVGVQLSTLPDGWIFVA